jgi:cell division septation protein DedD
MSEQDEKVHYQISVTGRQAAAFFLALLVALGLSFFFGMKTGAAAKKGPETVSALSQASDLPVPALKGEERRGGGPKGAEDVKLGFGSEKAEPSKSEPPPPAEPAKPTPAPPPAKALEATATPVPKPPAAPARTAPKKELHWVQVLATQKASAADDLTKKLKADGFPADVSPVPGKPGWFRVRVGPYADRAKAEGAAAKIQKVEKTKTRPLVVP